MGSNAVNRQRAMPMEADTETMDRRHETWHIGKQIPLALIAAVVLQTAGLVWSIAGLYNRVDTLVDRFNRMESERYTREDGRRDRELMMMQVQAQTQRDNEQDRRIATVESLANQWRVRQ